MQSAGSKKDWKGVMSLKHWSDVASCWIIGFYTEQNKTRSC